MKARVAAAVLVIGSLASIVGTLRAEVTAKQVRQAIDRGVQYLKSQQRVDGSWIEMWQPGGITALCTLALLDAGVDPSDESMQRALSYLRKIEPKYTYVVSLQTMVFARAEPEKDLLLIRRNVTWLEDTQIRHSEWYSGAWSYPGGEGDNSNSQFALLALHEAENVGVSASEQTWQLANDYWKRCQKENGAWTYNKQAPGTGSMTSPASPRW